MLSTLIYLVELYIRMRSKISHIFIYAKTGWGKIQTFELLPMWIKEIKLCVQELIPHTITIRDIMLL